ncbi:MAG: hypothetical protein ACXWAT_06775 [Methylobacter sp.]
MMNQQGIPDPLPGEHAANDTGPVDWNKYHEDGKTLKMPNRSKNDDKKTIPSSMQ